MIFKLITFFLISILTKDSLWVTVSKGAAVYLNPYTNSWEPIAQKQQIREHTFLLTKNNSEVVIYNQEQTVKISSNMYVYLNDLFVENKNQLMSKLNKIQMDQLPKTEIDKTGKKRSIGLTFGALTKPKIEIDIPYLKERINTVNYLDNENNSKAALLTLKRLMTKYPEMYFDYNYTKKLFDYYSEYNLKGMLYDESLALKQMDVDEKLKQFVISSHDKIKAELIKEKAVL